MRDPAPGAFTNIPSTGGQWLGFDPSGCDHSFNSNYLGPAGIGLEGKMFVSLVSGHQFDLTSSDFVGSDGGANGYLVQSSRGGYFSFSNVDNYHTLAFNEHEWSDLDWVVFSAPLTGVFSGFDNLVLEPTVPAPGRRPSMGGSDCRAAHWKASTEQRVSRLDYASASTRQELAADQRSLAALPTYPYQCRLNTAALVMFNRVLLTKRIFLQGVHPKRLLNDTYLPAAKIMNFQDHCRAHLPTT
jgi:hypothetical protein